MRTKRAMNVKMTDMARRKIPLLDMHKRWFERCTCIAPVLFSGSAEASARSYSDSSNDS